MPGLMPMASSAPSGFSSISRSRRSSQSAPLEPMTGAMRRPVSGCSAWKERAGRGAARLSATKTASHSGRRICVCSEIPLNCGIVTMRSPASSFLLAPLLIVLAGCNRQNTAQIDYQIGERINVGPLVYNVVETVWQSQLGETFKLRLPQQRFLLITVSATNGGGKEVSVPMLALESQNGQKYQESENGEGVDNWFGLLRNINPAQTRQGRLLFDVPLSNYKLRLTDGGNPGSEKYVWVNIPLRMDVDTGVATPSPGPGR